MCVAAEAITVCTDDMGRDPGPPKTVVTKASFIQKNSQHTNWMHLPRGLGGSWNAALNLLDIESAQKHLTKQEQ